MEKNAGLRRLFIPLAALMVAVPAAWFASRCLAPAPREKAETFTRVNNNLHQVDGEPAGPGHPEKAYRLYRSGAPSKKTFAKWCDEYHVERVIVLSGDAADNELAYQAKGICPEIKVVYDVKQHSSALGDGFLKLFDEQVAAARRDRAGLLIRCQMGAHRTGRLAAYYQMKYQGLSADQAIAVMERLGLKMDTATELVPQVKALDDYIHNRPCSQPAPACVIINSKKWVPK
ncbi:MAG TPA: hypothetical protein VM658_22275 [bacterium]|nr:hypothetical protein [bacterium]